VVQEEAQVQRVAQRKAPELVVYQKDLLEKERENRSRWLNHRV
jgi:hypothetical protein